MVRWQLQQFKNSLQPAIIARRHKYLIIDHNDYLLLRENIAWESCQTGRFGFIKNKKEKVI